MFMIKSLAGRLNEGWKLIEKHSSLYKKYEADLSVEAKEQLALLKKYFGNTNLVNTLRKKVSFHSDLETIKKGYESFSKEAIFIDCLSEYRGHCLYNSSELIGIMGMTSLVDGKDWASAIDKIAKEVVEVAGWMGEFILDFMKAFMTKYVSHTIQDIEKDKITIKNNPPMDSVIIPFFCSPPKKQS